VAAACHGSTSKVRNVKNRRMVLIAIDLLPCLELAQ